MADYKDIIEGLRIFATMNATGVPRAHEGVLYAGDDVYPPDLDPLTRTALHNLGWEFEPATERWAIEV